MAESMSCIFSTGRLWKLYKTRSFHFDIATAARTRWYSKGVLSGPVFGGGLKGISFVVSLASASSPSPSCSWTHTHRYLGTLKGYVANQARPEGLIIEAYVVKECLTFCSMYLEGTDRDERNDDGGVRGLGMGIFTQNVRPFALITRAPDPSQNERNMAHWFVLHNSPELKPYLDFTNVISIVFGTKLRMGSKVTMWVSVYDFKDISCIP